MTKTKKRWSVSESTLDKLWRKAVKNRYEGLCALCQKEGVEVHHIKSRRKKVLKWDVENGILLCAHCHNFAHRNQFWFYEKTKHIIDYEYLETHDITLIDYCQAAGITKDEFRIRCKLDLEGL